jgi:hypothetical protein
MAINRLNRLLRQYQVSEDKISVDNFIKLCESISTLQIFKSNTTINTNIQFDTAQLTGLIPQIKLELTQVEEDAEIHSMHCSFNSNLNPIRTLSISISNAQNLFTINGNNISKVESDEIIKLVDKYFKKEKNPRVIPNNSQIKQPDFQFLTGPFSPVKIPETISEKRVFVIMSFQPQHRDAYFVAIEPTLIKLGFEPIRIDQIQHNNTVTSEIVREIETSAFVVADLTGERPNVYYEVGWAHRAGKEVVLVAKKDTAVHFDVASISRIEYNDFTELCAALILRVKTICEKLEIKIDEK